MERANDQLGRESAAPVCWGMEQEGEDLAANRARGDLQHGAGSPRGACCLPGRPDALCSWRREKGLTHPSASSLRCAALGLLAGPRLPSQLRLGRMLGAR